MKTIKNISAAGVIVALMTCGLPAVERGREPHPETGILFARFSQDRNNPEQQEFFKAKVYLFQRDWKSAVSGLQSYLEKHPFGKMRDEAMFWLARSQNNLASEQNQPEAMIAFKENAVQTLDRLLDQHPGSLWKADAAALRIEIAGELVLIGKTEYRRHLDDIIRDQGVRESSLKLAALNSLLKLDPAAAIPILENIIRSDPDPQIRKNGILLLGRLSDPSVLDFLESTGGTDTDESVRAEAAYWAEQVRIRLIPVQLNYYVFTARLTDPSQLLRLPQNRIQDFQLPSPYTGDRNAIKQEINRLFKSKLSWLSTQATSRGGFRIPGEDLRISHNIHDFHIQVLRDTLKKRPDRIEGQVLIKDRLSGKTHYQSFAVSDGQDHLLAMRHDDRVALLALQFEALEKKDMDAQEAGDTAGSQIRFDPFEVLHKILGITNKPIFHTQYTNMMGCVVFSTLNSAEAARPESDLVDFSLAKAEIPSPEGTWELTGHLLLQKNERRFLARMGTLIDPDGDMAAVAEEILVPIDDAASFTVTNSRMEAAQALAEKPQASASPVYHTTFIKKDRVRIQSVRRSFDIDEFDAAILDCGQARAVFPVPEGAWILTGNLTWHKRNNKISARSARLVDQDDMLIAEGEQIEIPLDRLQDYQVKKQ